MLTNEQIAELQKIAKQNDGHCDRCHRVISIYKYSANKQISTMLRRMQKRVVELEGKNEVNFSDLSLPYRIESQRTKARLHGLIAKVKSNGTHVQNTWLITHKGWGWLKGESIPKTVVVFDNQVLGHEGGVINIKQVSSDAEVQKKPITTPEAKTYHDVRTPKKQTTTLKATPRFYSSYLDKSTVYEITIDRLQTGKPIKILKVCLVETITPIKNQHGYQAAFEYKDIADFQAAWLVV